MIIQSPTWFETIVCEKETFIPIVTSENTFATYSNFLLEAVLTTMYKVTDLCSYHKTMHSWMKEVWESFGLQFFSRKLNFTEKMKTLTPMETLIVENIKRLKK